MYTASCCYVRKCLQREMPAHLYRDRGHEDTQSPQTINSQNLVPDFCAMYFADSSYRSVQRRVTVAAHNEAIRTVAILTSFEAKVIQPPAIEVISEPPVNCYIALRGSYHFRKTGSSIRTRDDSPDYGKLFPNSRKRHRLFDLDIACNFPLPAGSIANVSHGRGVDYSCPTTERF